MIFPVFGMLYWAYVFQYWPSAVEGKPQKSPTHEFSKYKIQTNQPQEFIQVPYAVSPIFLEDQVS